MRFFKNFDFFTLALCLIISVLGLVMAWSLTPDTFPQQLAFVVLGFVFFFIFSEIDFKIFENLRWILYLFCLSFLVLTYIFGEVTRGSVRWIQIGSFTVQSSEIVKPFLILFFASIFSRWEEIKAFRLLILVILLVVPLVLVFKQPDLGSTLIILAFFGGMLLALGPSGKQMVGLGIFLLAAGPVFWLFLKNYQKTRILTFLDPYSDTLGAGYNLIQAMLTVGSGQIFGRGLGRGTQSHLAFLPERHTDFIFASYAEELGFLGAVLLLALYFLLLSRIIKLCSLTSSRFGSLICIGVFSMLCFQIFVNIGMNMGILPITGVTLPLVSSGGSSFLAIMISLGVVESVARQQKTPSAIEIR